MATTIAVGVVGAVLDWIAVHYRTALAFVISVDLLVALLCGVLVLKILMDARTRRLAMLRRLEMIADMNHHIRNALQQIHYSAHITKNQEVISVITDASERIQWALREVLPREERQD